MSTIKKRKSASRGRPAGSVKTKAGKANKTTIKSLSTLAALKQKIAEQKVEFLGKLKTAVDAAYAKGVADVLKDQKKRDAEKAKLIAAAERKFEKKYAQITAKKAKKTKKAMAKTAGKKTSSLKKATALNSKKVTTKRTGEKSFASTTGSRGRPRKTATTTTHHTPVISLVSTESHS